mmetsp:Transcript_12211/g.30651  ORF Transcript_12211/g.30651 Transcript_12211/m.30651 type:complete len:234 (-) Transcript_12211:345-1046(-)
MDPRKNTLTEEIIGVHVGLALGRHADVSLIDTKRLGLVRKRTLELKLLGGVPHDSVVARVGGGALGSLDGVGHPSRDTGGLLASRSGDGNLVARIMGNHRGTVGVVGDKEVPNAKVVLGVRVVAAVPAIEVSKQGKILGVGSPLSGNDARLVGVRAAAHAKLLIALGKVLKGSFGLADVPLELLVLGVAVLEASLPRLERRVPLHYTAAILLLPLGVRLLIPILVLESRSWLE